LSFREAPFSACGFGANIDDVEFEAPSFEFNPEQNVNCNLAVQQSAAASG
jgi:hypothetical protein